MHTKGQAGDTASRTTPGLPPDSEWIAFYKKDAREIAASHLSPLRLFMTIMAGIFLAEVVAMLVVYLLGSLPYSLITLVDAATMTVMISPLLYFLAFRPLLLYIQKKPEGRCRLAPFSGTARKIF